MDDLTYFAGQILPTVYIEYIRGAGKEYPWIDDWREAVARDAFQLAEEMVKRKQQIIENHGEIKP